MQCPMCKQLRHPGPCDPVYEDDGEPDFINFKPLSQSLAELRAQEEMDTQ